ncbi:bifunctional pyr operon transcriptional regulator/uracil phosphoribosyltransferase PyrR [Candidatus Desantisbacteria bacterium]|nr:bifunctional pyr operon transcriptional regulator/uracil phosphoribosyltransferase PyrR [Candidatus Desantisbacteria bacterium]
MQKKQLMSKKQLNDILDELINKIIKKNKDMKDLVIIGIHTRGVYLAKRIALKIKNSKKIDVPQGSIDITFYRDDVSSLRKKHPTVKGTDISFSIVNKNILLVDDVIYTGRTIRAALNELIDFGRPQKIQLAVLIDRGNRELPIHPDFTGKIINTPKHKKIKVQLKEIDETEGVVIYPVKS